MAGREPGAVTTYFPPGLEKGARVRMGKGGILAFPRKEYKKEKLYNATDSPLVTE